MRAAIFRNGEIVADTLPEPEPGAGTVLVKTLACGICGSDLHARKHAHRMAEFSRHLPGRKPMDLTRDVVFGHEFCCEILDYGPSTQRKLKPGTRRRSPMRPGPSMPRCRRNKRRRGRPCRHCSRRSSPR
jgi:threonine dehydrogenase-like Zn-dependent dehydrogenase